MSTSVVNLGCRLNGYESSVIDKILQTKNIDNLLIVNTCAVTAEAEKQSRQAVRKLKRENPDKKIIVTGCAAQINPSQFSSMSEVEVVLGNDNKMNDTIYQQISLNDVLTTEKAIINDIMSIKETAMHMIPLEQDRSRAFLQIQNGCNHRCTFCIIPYGRGNSRSVPVGQVIENIKQLVDAGYNEVVLTGVDATEYGLDLPGAPRLGNLCKRILHSTSLRRLRLSSIDVAEIDDDLKDLIKSESRFMPYFHISLQSGDNLILKRMKRRHTREDVLEFCEFVRKYRPDAGFGADIICGFPTENDAMFSNTKNLVCEAQIPYLHVFTYSARKGTPAARMPQVELQIRKDRTKELISVGKDVLNSFLNSMIGSKVSIIGEVGGVGKSENFAPVKIENIMPDEIVGRIVNVQCTRVESFNLIGKIC